MSLSGKNKNFLGVDIGSTSIKMVELTLDKGRLKLVNYAFSEMIGINREWQNNTDYVALSVKKVKEESGIKSNNALASLPTFAVFSSVLSFSNINKKELEAAINWEAKKVIPLPLEEMVLDWKIINEQEVGKDRDYRILITGAPKKLVKKYLNIFKVSNLNLNSLETETFSLIRSLIGGDPATVMLVEIGANTTDISIVDNSIPILNRSLDMGGNSITKTISNNLNVSWDRAEQFKYDLGISVNQEGKQDIIPKNIEEVINPLVNEIKYLLNTYNSKNKKNVEKIILSGGSSLLQNLPEYLSSVLNKKVLIGDPWSRIAYPVDLKPILDEIAPKMSVAIGLAMRGVE